ncbi:hypothetical protein [Paenibacillus crassostreae]|uniref:Uncharacterized protein n=1 Tax=Paenibacillus crassostreae TaxID=1763538 RepID=A0A167C629_9BACL|nr:hypothetical protein [Paenibacillus crassostreae]AOZ91601.1 hypothetical protein LPB68_04805 [Paenibacillus crassostreae]OAB72824.1 hypothetical protein PNBC_15445 [Paenibacillus crassostreae]
MGLDFNKGGAHWSYSGFYRFRVRVAETIGIDLDKMSGFASLTDNSGIGWDWVTDPVVPLLNHSDCDGGLTPDQCRSIAPRLKEIIANWNAPDDYDKAQAELLIEGMEYCAQTNVPLEFI